MTNEVPMTLTIFGATLTVTLQGALQCVGIVVGMLGLYLTWQRNMQMKRANDLKEQELNQNAQAKNSKEKLGVVEAGQKDEE